MFREAGEVSKQAQAAGVGARGCSATPHVSRDPDRCKTVKFQCQNIKIGPDLTELGTMRP